MDGGFRNAHTFHRSRCSPRWRPVMAYRNTARFVLSVMLAVPIGAAEANDSRLFDSLVQSRFVHCAFYKNYEIDRETGDRLLIEGKSDSLTYYQRAGAGATRAITTRMAGARDVTVMQNGKFLHFIDSVAGMYSVTTVDSCLDFNERLGVCVIYGAYNARHFDSRVLVNPDGVFEALRASADPGFCDYSFIGVQEASGR